MVNGVPLPYENKRRKDETRPLAKRIGIFEKESMGA
jgi:hypothetical protein